MMCVEKESEDLVVKMRNNAKKSQMNMSYALCVIKNINNKLS